MKDNNKRYFEIADGKPIYAQWFCSIDIGLWVEDEVINNVDFTAKDRETGDVVTDIFDAIKSTFTGNRYLKPFIKAGSAGKKYRVKMEVQTAEGSQDEFYLDLYIRNG